jgi:hypothetical protein
VTFSQLTTTGHGADPGDIVLLSDRGSILGGSISANGNAQLSSNNSLSLSHISGGSLDLSAPHDLTIALAEVKTDLTLGADVINVTVRQTPSTPPVPLHMSVTGFNGGVATTAHLVIDPPSLIFDHYSVVDSTVTANAPFIQFVDGYVPGQMTLTTPTQLILLDNRSPAPEQGPSLQLYQPGGLFNLIQDQGYSFVNTYVVFYTGGIDSVVSTYSPDHACCAIFGGSSFVRNVPSDLDFDVTNSDGKTGPAGFYLLGVPAGTWIDGTQIIGPVQVIGDGPAVNVEGLIERPRHRRHRRRHEDDTRLRGQPGRAVALYARAN